MPDVVGESAAVALDIGQKTGRAPADAIADLQLSDEPAAKKVALGHAIALAGLTLQLVMQFAGKNDGIFVTSVCKGWKRSYKSTFKSRARTHRAAALISMQRLHWIWSEPLSPQSNVHLYRDGKESPSWYIGKYAPRSIVEEAILDKSLAIRSEDLMEGVASSGRVNLLGDLWDDYFLGEPRTPGYDVSKLLVEAAKCGHLLAFARVWNEFLEADKPHRGELAAQVAARGGYIQILEFLCRTDWWSGGDNGPANLGKYAAAGDQLAVLSWLPAHGHLWVDEHDNIALAAAAHGSVATINFLFGNHCPGMGVYFVDCCVQYDRLDALQWCYDTLRVSIPDLWTAENLQEWLLRAGAFDSRRVAKFLLEHGARWPDIGQRFGAWLEDYDDNGNCSFDADDFPCTWTTPFFEWAMTEGCTLDTWTTATCARLASITEWETDCPLLETLAFAHAHGSPCVCARTVPDF